MRLNFDKSYEYVIRRIGGKRDEASQNSLFIDQHSITYNCPDFEKGIAATDARWNFVNLSNLAVHFWT